MKQLILLLSIFIALQSRAQIPYAGANFVRPELNKFEGTWNYTSGTDTFKFVLKKVNMHFPIKNYHDETLVGTFRYVKNGVEVYNNLNDYDTVIQNHNKSKIYLKRNDQHNVNFCKGLIKDSIKNKQVDIAFTFKPNTSPSQVDVKFYARQGAQAPNIPEGTVFPPMTTTLTFTKQ